MFANQLFQFIPCNVRKSTIIKKLRTCTLNIIYFADKTQQDQTRSIRSIRHETQVNASKCAYLWIIRIMIKVCAQLTLIISNNKVDNYFLGGVLNFWNIPELHFLFDFIHHKTNIIYLLVIRHCNMMLKFLSEIMQIIL